MYPKLGTNASNAKKAHAFVVSKQDLCNDQLIPSEVKLKLPADRCGAAIQMCAEIEIVKDILMAEFFDPANMFDLIYKCRTRSRYPKHNERS